MARLILLPFRVHPSVPDIPDVLVPIGPIYPQAGITTLQDVRDWFQRYLGRQPADDAEAIGYGRVGQPRASVELEIATSQEALDYLEKHGIQAKPKPLPIGTLPGTSTGAAVIHDITAMLPTEPANIPATATHLKESITFHWEGGDAIQPMGTDATIGYLQDVARQHIARDWGGGQRGAYIMYHEAIAQNGDSFRLHDDTDVVWHCGDYNGNLTSRAILVICSAATPPTIQQLAAVRRRTQDFGAPVHAHSDWSPTQCPGDVVRGVVADLRRVFG